MNNVVHTIYYYMSGAEAYTKAKGKKPGSVRIPAAKCKCGWEGIGHEEIAEHEVIANTN